MMSMAENELTVKTEETEKNGLSCIPSPCLVPSKRLLMQLHSKGEKRNGFTWVKNRNDIYNMEEII